jgi:hypothetical protein
MSGWVVAMTTVDEHRAMMHAFMREEHEEFIAKVRGWAEKAQLQGRLAAARQHREHLARLEAMETPWGLTLRSAE